MTTLSFHRSLYPPAAVAAAVAAYADLARFDVQEEDHRCRVEIADIDADFAEFPDEFADSFANHVLFETVRARRAGSLS